MGLRLFGLKVLFHLRPRHFLAFIHVFHAPAQLNGIFRIAHSSKVGEIMLEKYALLLRGLVNHRLQLSRAHEGSVAYLGRFGNGAAAQIWMTDDLPLTPKVRRNFAMHRLFAERKVRKMRVGSMETTGY